VILGLFLSFVAAAAQFVGGWMVIREKGWPRRWERSLLALGAGFQLALVFIELIPESFKLTEFSPYAVLAMLAGFSAIHFFEHTLVEHMHFGEETHAHPAVPHSSIFGAIGGLTVHAFFDGMSIAAAASAQPKIGVLVFVAVLLHKMPEGLTVASILRHGRHATREVRLATLALAASTIVGALLVLFFVSIQAHLIGLLFAFSAGASVYVGASDLIPEVNKSRGRWAPLVVFLGMLGFWLGERALSVLLGL
jgi:zinc transporter ZupT